MLNYVIFLRAFMFLFYNVSSRIHIFVTYEKVCVKFDIQFFHQITTHYEPL